jgi:hypothetical protein
MVSKPLNQKELFMAEQQPIVQEAQLTAKPGIKTTEFAFSVAVFFVGVLLIAKGNEELGSFLIATSGLGYNYARGQAKRDVPLEAK